MFYVIGCGLIVACSALFVAWWLSCGVCCLPCFGLMCDVRCASYIVRCVIRVVCCMLFDVLEVCCCLLHDCVM